MSEFFKVDYFEYEEYTPRFDPIWIKSKMFPDMRPPDVAASPPKKPKLKRHMVASTFPRTRRDGTPLKNTGRAYVKKNLPPGSKQGPLRNGILAFLAKTPSDIHGIRAAFPDKSKDVITHAVVESVKAFQLRKEGVRGRYVYHVVGGANESR